MMVRGPVGVRVEIAVADSHGHPPPRLRLLSRVVAPGYTVVLLVLDRHAAPGPLRVVATVHRGALAARSVATLRVVRVLQRQRGLARRHRR